MMGSTASGTDPTRDSRNELHRDGVQGTTSPSLFDRRDMPAKQCYQVREATNNEPWGASSTMMNEIASATFN